MKDALDPATEQALDWLVQFSASPRNTALQARFEQWRRASLANEQAWSRVNGRLDGLFANIRELDSRIPGQAGEVRRALLQTPQRRRLIGKILGLSGAMLGGTLLIDRYQPLCTLSAGVRTGTGERRSVDLADGSRLTLNARSAADVRFDQDFRRIRLRHGALIAEVAPDPGRPFVVETAFGTVRALGTRFMVRQDAHGAYVNVLEHAVSVHSVGGAGIEVQAGQGVNFDQAGVGPLRAGQDEQAAWSEGWITLQDAPLSTLVDALQPYFPGYLRLTEAAARTRVQGVFSLDHPLQTLAALQETQTHLLIRNVGGMLVLIEQR